MKAKKAVKPAKLFPQEAKLVSYLGKMGTASVAQIARVIFPPPTLAELKKSPRTMHQRVGAVAFRVNRKRRSFKIKPSQGRPGFYALHQYHA